jgi:uroporphyrinogen-III synthase
VLAVGPATAREIEQMGLRAYVAPADFGGLGSLLEKIDGSVTGTYLYPCSEAAPTESRADEARKRGIELMPFAFYENEPCSPGPLPAQPFSQVLFTSPSTVASYFTNYPDEIHSSRAWLAIGPSTKEALRQIGLKGVMIDDD